MPTKNKFKNKRALSIFTFWNFSRKFRHFFKLISLEFKALLSALFALIKEQTEEFVED